MRLATIREKKARDKKPEQSGIPTPRTAEEADALFWKGIRAMDERNDEEAFRIFDYLSRYEGEAPPGLVDGARLGRDFVDPDLSPTEKANQFFDLFPGRIIHVYDADQGLESGEPPDGDEGELATMDEPADVARLSWLSNDELFAFAFHSLERGDLEAADHVLALFLERTQEEPATPLRATAMLARNVINAEASRRDELPKPDRIMTQCIEAIIQSSSAP